MPVMVRIDEPADAYGAWIAATADYGVAVVSQDRALHASAAPSGNATGPHCGARLA